MEKTDVIRICWCSPHPNHYNNYLFQHIGSLSAIELELVFFQKILPKYPWKSEFDLPLKTCFLDKRAGVDWKWALRQVFTDQKKLFLVAGWNEPTMIFLLTMLAILNRPYILWSDTPRTQKIRSIRNYLRAHWLNFIFKRCYYFFVTGKPGMAAARTIGVPEGKIVNFPFATNIEYFKPALTEKTDYNHFISSGRLDIAHKGYDTALQALAICRKHLPDVPFKYTVAGTGPDESVIRSLIEEYGLCEIVELKGWLEPEELLAFYQSGDALIHAANFDPFPNAVLEAMACGLPVIGSKSAGSAEDRIVSGENGFLHDPQNPEDLACRIIDFLLLPKDSKVEMGKQARYTAEKWSVDYHLNVFKEKIYEGITGV